MIKILICDNQLLTSEGMVSVLQNMEDVQLISVGKGPAEMKALVNEHQPKVIIIDPYYGNFSIDDIKYLRSHFNFIKILVLSNWQQKEKIIELINAGVKHFVSKECSYEDIILAIYATAKDGQFYCKVTRQIFFGDSSVLKEGEEMPILTIRETEIIQLISAGMTNKKIAEKLFLSIHTVKTHRKNIIKKIGFTFKNAADLMLYTAKFSN